MITVKPLIARHGYRKM